MHKITLFPLGNADCCRIDLECGKKILFDFADSRDPEDEDDLRCDLPKELREDLEESNRDYFDVVAFSHLDKDHFNGATEFFFLEHAKKYQSDDRIKMNVMWVPAALITEQGPEDDEARILQKEARHRFREGKGIRVFSRPERLRQWCKKNDINLDDRLHLITDAGEVAPEFTLSADKVEFFVHSPFAVRQDENTVEDRNEDSLVMHVTFEIDGVLTKALLLADSTHEALSDIVDITRSKGNDHRLEWDIAKLPHHCSYLSIGPEKGKSKTKAVEQVDWLYKEQGQSGAIAVSTSNPIPEAGTDEDKDDQPPHRQAAAYYKDVVADLNGQFVVTMEHPTPNAAKPLVIEIGRTKGTLKKSVLGAAYIATSQRAPRAG
jgi:ribonuclease BN (tRNA processing enzyme)